MTSSPSRPGVYDVLVLGGGSAGYSCALRASQLGMSVAIIERDKVGGTCLHQGCVPTKALLHAAEVADVVRSAGTVGIVADLQTLDARALNDFKDGVVDRLYRGLQGLITANDVTVIGGAGRLVSPTTVEVDGESHTGRHLVLATGATPRTLPGVPVEGRVVTSVEALESTSVPERAVVIGGSVIGVEFASLWRSLGAHVTVLEALPSLVPLEDPSLGKQLRRAFTRRGIEVRTDARVREVSQDEHGARVLLDEGSEFEADLVLVAVGRVPNTADLGLDEAGIRTDGGWIVTSDRLQTSMENVWAVGDVVAGLQLAHRGFAHGIFVAEEIAGLDPAVVLDAQIPRVTYCHPEIASVGLTEPQARERYAERVEVVHYDLAGNGKSQILGAAGSVTMIAVTDGPIVGIHLLGTRMSEQVGEASLLVNWEATGQDAARYVHAHPTQNEALGEAALALAGKPLHAHG